MSRFPMFTLLAVMYVIVIPLVLRRYGGSASPFMATGAVVTLAVIALVVALRLRAHTLVLLSILSTLAGSMAKIAGDRLPSGPLHSSVEVVDSLSLWVAIGLLLYYLLITRKQASPTNPRT